APRGEDMHYVRANGTDKPDRVRVRAASEANWHGMAHMLEGDYLADVPIIIAAIDPCYSCTDRSFVLKQENGGQMLWDWRRLREYSIEWYKKRGVDITKLTIDK
ncbi:MAG: NADH dehydrogenase subunit, partial [Firmicutes bacterium]|nr:NADH dehydrogenase subunit [Bacillota bacterium]